MYSQNTGKKGMIVKFKLLNQHQILESSFNLLTIISPKNSTYLAILLPLVVFFTIKMKNEIKCVVKLSLKLIDDILL